MISKRKPLSRQPADIIRHATPPDPIRPRLQDDSTQHPVRLRKARKDSRNSIGLQAKRGKNIRAGLGTK